MVVTEGAVDELMSRESVSEKAGPNEVPFGLRTRDVVLMGAATMLCIGHIPLFVLPGTPLRLAVVVVLGALGLVVLARLARHRDLAATVGLSLVVWILTAAVMSGAPTIAMRGMYGRELSGLIVIGVLGLWAIGRASSLEFARALPTVLTACLAFSSLVGIAQVVFEVRTGFLSLYGSRATGLTSNPVYFGALTAAGAGLLTAARSIPPAFRIAGALMFGVACNLSGSRVAAAAGVIAILTFTFLPSDADRLRHRVVYPCAFLAGLMAGSILSAGGETSTDRLVSSGDGGRWTAWRYGSEAVLARPISGWGFGRFRAATQEHYSADFVRQFAADDAQQAWFDGHNLLVTAAVAIGVVGVLVLLVFSFLAARSAHGPLAYFVSVLMLTWLLQPAGLATLPIGMLALGAATPRLLDSTRVTVCRTDWVTRSCVAVGCAVGAWVLVGDAVLKRALDGGTAREIENAAQFFPGDSVVADLVAQAWFIAEEDDPSLRPEVLKWSMRSVDREPDRPFYWARHAGRLLTFDDSAAARESLAEAIRLEPWHLQSWLLLRELGCRTGDQQLVGQSAVALSELGVERAECASPTLPQLAQP